MRVEGGEARGYGRWPGGYLATGALRSSSGAVLISDWFAGDPFRYLLHITTSLAHSSFDHFFSSRAFPLPYNSVFHICHLYLQTNPMILSIADPLLLPKRPNIFHDLLAQVLLQDALSVRYKSHLSHFLKIVTEVAQDVCFVLR